MKILIVDDSRVMRMLVRRTLRQANIGEHDYEEADNGSDALDKLKAFSADLILSDWNMPSMDGPGSHTGIGERHGEGGIRHVAVVGGSA